MNVLKTLLSIMPVSVLENGLIALAGKVADTALKGEELDATGQKIIRTGYFLINEWVEDLVKSSDTVYDDAALNEVKKQLEDAADEGGFELD